MSYFSKNNILLWVIIVLLIIILSALGTMMHRMNKRIRGFRQEQDSSITNVMKIKEALDLNDDQAAKVKQIKSKHRGEQLRIRNEVFTRRQAFTDELNSDNPDTKKLNAMIRDITNMQVRLKKESIKEYLEIRSLCTPEQQKKLELIVRNKQWGMGNRSRRNHSN